MTSSSLVDDVLSHKKSPEDIYRSAGSNFTYRPICFSLWRAVDNGLAESIAIVILDCTLQQLLRFVFRRVVFT